MYTQCPECRTVFRVTAEILKQASGKVRCGDCGSAFDALRMLSEDRPEPGVGANREPSLPRLEPEKPAAEARPRLSPEQSAEVLKSLEQFTSENIRFEDTGVEWRLLGESDVDNADDEHASAAQLADTDVSQVFEAADDEDRAQDGDGRQDASPAAPDFEATDVLEDDAVGAAMRFDDDTHLPDDFDRDAEESPPATEPPPVAKASSPGGVEADSDLALGERDEWEDLLGEVVGSRGKTDPERPTLEAAVAEGAGPPPADEVDRAAGGDAEEPRQAAQAETPSEALVDIEEVPVIETIVMEGDAVQTALEDEPHDDLVEFHIEMSGNDAGTAALDFAASEREPRRRAGVASILGVTVMALLLGVQLIHHSREAIATIPALGEVVGPIYRRLGLPLRPAWDVAGWRFEVAGGSTDDRDEILTIFTRLGNQGEQELPYPLVHVSLTDRFEEVIGSRVFEPAEYLLEDADPRKRVAGGTSFDAVMLIESPSADATGFKLNACYRAAVNKLRCAIDDFK